MSELIDASPSHEQQAYWHELLHLKAEACYVREYRDSLGKWVTSIAAIRAITSYGSIATWLLWKKFAFLWAGLIAASQLGEALKDVFPFYRRRRSLSRWCTALDRHFVEAQRDWDEISSGEYTNPQIRKLCHRLRLRKGRAEAKYIPDGLDRKIGIARKAELEATEFFRAIYTQRQH